VSRRVPDGVAVQPSAEEDLLRALGITEQQWFRGGELLRRVARGRVPAGLPCLERPYFLFGDLLDTTRFSTGATTTGRPAAPCALG